MVFVSHHRRHHQHHHDEEQQLSASNHQLQAHAHNYGGNVKCKARRKGSEVVQIFDKLNQEKLSINLY